MTMKKNLKHRLASRSEEIENKSKNSHGKEEEAQEEKSDKKEEKKKGYDPEKDKVVKEVGEIKGDSERGGKITVRIASYNNGPKKISIMLKGENKDGKEWFAKLGRITKRQSKKLRILLRKADQFLED
jgi:hypothetical protein